jgi:uncharacterized protein
MKNPVVHFEIYARDANKLAQFYSSLFDWSIEAMPGMDYHYVKTVDTDEKGTPTKPGGIKGGLLVRPAGFEDRGMLIDPQGNTFAMWERDPNAK